MFDADLPSRHARVQIPLLAATLVLMVLGAAFIYSATVHNPHAPFIDWYRRDYVKQIIFYLVGLGLAAGVCLWDYRRLARWSLVGYWFSILLLLAVFVVGVNRYGAQRWIDLGPFQFQPSEFSKIAFVFALGNFLSRPAEELRQPGVFLKVLGMTALPFLLILKEPDLGSALVLLPVALAMMFVASVPRGYLLRLLSFSGSVVVLLVLYILFAPTGWRQPVEQYQRERLLVYFGRDFAPKDATPEERRKARARQRDRELNVEQAMISVGSGGLAGKGWCQGTQNALGFLPPSVAHNDFIFSVIAEEKGFLGSVTVLLCYGVITFAGIRIAGQARDRLGRLLAVGLVTLLFSHVFINIGMNIRLMPVTGIPLPLLSYGGTSVLCSLVALGLLQNIHLYRRS